jgi:hypothetical protein
VWRQRVLLTKFGDRLGGDRAERGTVRFLAVAKAADGPLECRDEIVFDAAPHLLSRGACDG